MLYDLSYLHGGGQLYEEMRLLGYGIPEVNYLEELHLFTNPSKFVNTGFNIETSTDGMDGEAKAVKRLQICTNEYSNLCFGRQMTQTQDNKVFSANSGILIRTCTELDILELQRINQELLQKKSI